MKGDVIVYSEANEINESRSLNPWERKVGTSSSLFGTMSEKALLEIKEGGLDCVEVCLFNNWFDINKTGMESYCREVAAYGKKVGVEFWSVHLPFGHDLDISTIDNLMRNKIVRKLADHMKFACCFGPKKVVIHGSYEPIISEGREERIAVCRQSLFDLSCKANQLGMQLAVECLPRTCLGNDIKEMKQLIEGIDLLGVCCDTNHLLTDRTEELIKAIGSRIVTLHVSDYDRIDEKHWLPGQGINDWNAITGALESIGYEGPIMFEVSQRKTGGKITPSDLKKCWNSLLEKYKSRSLIKYGDE